MKDLIRKFIGFKELFFPSWEERQLEKKRFEFYGQFISRGDLVFDVGANMGNRTKIFLQLGAKVVAIEPQKKCCTFLKLRFGRKVIIIPKGLGEKEDKKLFYIADISVLSSFSEEFIKSTNQSGRFKQYKWNKSEYVDITTLDLLIKEYGIPRFIKIDVEGYELEVLKGLSYLINYVSFEYAVPELITNTIDCIKQIEGIFGNTTLFNYSARESMEFALDVWLPFDKMIDYIFSQDFENTGFGDIYAHIFDKY